MNSVMQWLLSSDPSVRYRTLKYLAHEKQSRLKSEQQAMLKKGWISELIKRQDSKGTWGNGIYSPKWISTTYTLLLLKRLEAPVTDGIRKACSILGEKGRSDDEGVNFSASMNRSETCITGMVLSIAAFFDTLKPFAEGYVRYLEKEQMEDGGWNCRSYRGAVHSSFHTTINALEGLWEYERMKGGNKHILAMRRKGEEFLLKHRLYKSHRTGEIVDRKMTMLSFPPRWRYDVMRVMEYFADSNALKDSRMQDAMDIIISKEKNGRWPVQQKHPGRVFFDLEPAGRDSAVNTLRAMRILKWWEGK